MLSQQEQTSVLEALEPPSPLTQYNMTEALAESWQIPQPSEVSGYESVFATSRPFAKAAYVRDGSMNETARAVERYAQADGLRRGARNAKRARRVGTDVVNLHRLVPLTRRTFGAAGITAGLR